MSSEQIPLYHHDRHLGNSIQMSSELGTKNCAKNRLQLFIFVLIQYQVFLTELVTQETFPMPFIACSVNPLSKSLKVNHEL